MRIVLAQQNYHIGNFGDNTRKIIEAIEQAKKEQADLVVFFKSLLYMRLSPPGFFRV